MPSRTTSMAGLASGSIFTNHCSLSIGSTTSPERCERGRVILCFVTPRSRPSSSSLARTALRPCLIVRPWNSPQCSLSVPSRLKIVISSSGGSWRRPVAKSLGSCAGVTFTAPVPSSMSTRIASVMIGTRRSTNGMLHELAVKVCVALVVGVHGDRGVAQHRLGTRRGDDQLFVGVLDRVRELVELSGNVLFLVDLEVAEHRLGGDVPVHHAQAAVDQPLVVEAHERLAHGAREVRDPW